MTLKQIAALGRMLVAFLGLFADCFGRRESRELLRIYVQGQMSNLHRHFYLTQASYLFCARIRQQCAASARREAE